MKRGQRSTPTPAPVTVVVRGLRPKGAEALCLKTASSRLLCHPVGAWGPVALSRISCWLPPWLTAWCPPLWVPPQVPGSPGGLCVKCSLWFWKRRSPALHKSSPPTLAPIQIGPQLHSSSGLLGPLWEKLPHSIRGLKPSRFPWGLRPSRWVLPGSSRIPAHAVACEDQKDR